MKEREIAYLIAGLLLGFVVLASPTLGFAVGCCPLGEICIPELPSCGICGDTTGPGGTDIPCHCGNTVVTNTKLNGSDPVLKTRCPCDGLIVNSGVMLQIGGTIQGQENNACSGIRLAPGATDVAVKIGRIAGFRVGVEAGSSGAVAHSQFSRLQIVESGVWGMLLTGDDNVVESNVITGSGVPAIDISGDRNTVSLNRIEEGVFGIVVGGRGNVVSRNLVVRNALDGLLVFGDHASVDRNRSTDNNGQGFVIDGESHALSFNIADGNLLDGFTVFATTSAFTRNRSNDNGRRPDGAGFGVADFTTGGGTGGTANAYTDNRCTGNGLGDSSPLGLCF